MKYVLFAVSDTAGWLPTVRIFDDITGHNEVKAEVQSVKPGLEVISAGKIWINGERVGCTHESVSLGLSFDEHKSIRAAETIRTLLKND